MQFLFGLIYAFVVGNEELIHSAISLAAKVFTTSLQ